jgi:integrase
MKTTRNDKGVWVTKEGNVAVKTYETVSRGYPLYQVANYSEGFRKLESFGDRADAIARAEDIVKLIAKGEREAAALSNVDRTVYQRALGLIQPTGVPLDVAAGIFAEAYKIAAGRIIEACRDFARRNPIERPAVTLEALVADLLKAKEARGASVRYLEDLRARLTRLAKDINIDAGAVTTAILQQWLDAMKLSRQSYENFRRVTHTLFEFAVTRGFVAENPAGGLERVKTNGHRPEIYTAEQVQKLLAAAPKEYRASLAIQAFSGLRSAEVERLKWEDVDLDSGHIVMDREITKTDSRRIAHVPDNLKAWLRGESKRTGKVWKGTHRDFYTAQETTAKAAEVKWKANALRHSYASYRLAETQSAAQVSLEMGNSPAVVLKHYRELVKPAQAAAWFSVKPQ